MQIVMTVYNYYSVNELMPFELRVVQKLLSAGSHLANVEPLSVCHLMFTIGAYKIHVRFLTYDHTLVREDLPAVILRAGVSPLVARGTLISGQGIQVKVGVGQACEHFEGLLSRLLVLSFVLEPKLLLLVLGWSLC